MSDIKMPDVNSVLMAGNLTSDPVYNKTPYGESVANFYVASNKKYRDNSGVWRESVCYIGVVAWDKIADSCSQVLTKNSSVLINGELQSKNWQIEDGSTKNVVEIRARKIQFLDQNATQAVQKYFAHIADGPVVVNKEAEGPLQKTSDDIYVGPTEFDFGYQDLKL